MKIKSAVTRKKRHKKILNLAKGYRGRRSKVYRRAVETVRRALVYAYRDRRTKKREFRSLWITRINAALRERGLTYSQFTSLAKGKGLILSRDILAVIAAEHPDVFDAVVATVKK